MQADFLDSYERHWDDANTLFTAQRWANADHLYGFSAECGLKCLMVLFGMPHVNFFPTERDDRVHINMLRARYESYLSGSSHAAGYGLASVDPFLDWDASDRYACQSNFGEARVLPHQAGASEICALLKKARLEGLIQ